MPDASDIIRRALGSGCFATTAMLCAVNDMGMDVFDADPDVLESMLEERYKLNIPKSSIHRLMAGCGLLSSDLFWTDPLSFAACCRILNGKNELLKRPASVEDIAWGVTEARMIHGEEDLPKFSTSVQSYVKAVLDEMNMERVPQSLKDFQGASPSNKFFGDPLLSQSIHEEQGTKADEVDTYVADRLDELVKLMHALPIAYQEQAKKELTETTNGQDNNTESAAKRV